MNTSQPSTKPRQATPSVTKFRDLTVKRKSRAARRRSGITMLELVVAGSMLAIVMTSLSVVLRTSRQSWEANDSDAGSLQHAHAVTRHFVRQGRESLRVEAIAADGSDVTLGMRDGTTVRWSYVASTADGMTDVVMVESSATGGKSPLAHGIHNLKFTGYQADGFTPAVKVEKIRLVKISADVLLDRNNSAKRTVSSNVWIRSW